MTVYHCNIGNRPHKDRCLFYLDNNHLTPNRRLVTSFYRCNAFFVIVTISSPLRHTLVILSFLITFFKRIFLIVLFFHMVIFVTGFRVFHPKNYVNCSGKFVVNIVFYRYFFLVIFLRRCNTFVKRFVK